MIRKYIYFSLFFLALSLSVKNVSAFTCGVDTVSRDELTYGTVAGADGNCWLDRNLGATRKATAYNDTQAYGWLFQWGRGADGHQIRTSTTTNVRSYLIVPSHGFFIVVSNLLYNWTTSSGVLWNGVNGIGNPCPIGWRIPTQSELSVMAVREGITNVSSAYASSLKMTAAGTRGLSDGALGVVGTYGVYWSSDFRKGFLFNSSAVNRNYEDYLATGLSVRCIKDTSVTSPNLTTQSVTDITPIQAMLTASLIATGGDDPVRSIQLTTISNNYSAPSECTAGTGSTGTYSCTLSSLTPNTTYYYRAKATNSAGTSYGDEMSFTTQSLPVEVTIPNPNDSALSNAVTNAYFSLNQGTPTNTQEIKTNTTVKLTTTNTTVTLPPNTTITETSNNSFNFTNFITENTTQQVKQFTPSLAAVKVGVPNTKMAFSNPITLTLTVGEAYNNKTLNILYQEDGETTWNPQGTCVITNGQCTFQTDHATTYTVNGDGTISGAGQNDITTDVQDVLSMDCDQTGNTNDNIVEFGNLTPGTPVTGSTTCTVTTNSDAGYTLAVKREDTNSTMDKDSDTATDITDRTIWNNSTPNATTWQTNDTGLAFTVYNTTATKNTSWWGTGTTVTDANNNYAGFPTSYTDIMQHAEYDETATTTQIGYKLDVPTTQKSGIYSGDITYQVVTAP